MAKLTKTELKTRLLSIIETLPTQEEANSGSFTTGFNLEVIETGRQLLTEQAKKELVAKIKSAKTTKVQLRRAFVLLGGLVKVAVLFA